MILLCEAVKKKIYRVDVSVDEHKWTCEDLVLMCNAVNQSYDIPMDVPLVHVSDHLLYIIQESDMPLTLIVM